jgi:hypothetical protein
MVERGPGISGGGGGGDDGDEAEAARRDSHDDDSAWMRSLFVPELAFGALLTLRRDALPAAGRALPCARRALARAAASAGRRLPRLDVSQDRAARAVLRGFPRAVVRAQPAARLSAELLVGFDPVAALLARLSASLGAFASFSADARGGAPCVGVRWRREAFAARPLKGGGALAQCCVPVPALRGGGVGGGVAAKKKKEKKNTAQKKRRRGEEEEEDEEEEDEAREEEEAALMLVPDAAQVLREAQEIGAGIVDHALMFG